MRPVWGVGLALVVGALIAPGSAAAAGDCSQDPYPSGTATRCNITAELTQSPDPLVVGQVATFTITMTNEVGSTRDEDVPNPPGVESTFGPDTFPEDNPGTLQSATVTEQPTTSGNWGPCTLAPGNGTATCKGPLKNGEHATYQVKYLVTGSPRDGLFMLEHMIELNGEAPDMSGFDANDEDALAFTDVVAASSSGGNKPAGGGGIIQALLDRIPPAFLGASIKPRTFLVGKDPTAEFARTKTGTTIVYNLSEAGTVRMAVERKLEGRRVRGKCVRRTRRNRAKRRCARYVQKGALARRAAAGISVIPWTGRIGRRVVKPGRYRMSLVAVDAANNRSAPRRMSFRVQKPKAKRKRKH